MPVFIPAFVAGICLLQQLPQLPTRLQALLLALTACIALLVWAAVAAPRRAAGARRQKSVLVARHLALALAAATLGLSYAGLRADYRLADELPTTSEGRDITLIGRIDSLPEQDERATRFEFAVESASLPVPRRLRLSWHAGDRHAAEHADGGEKGVADASADPVPPLRAGARWQLAVRLRRPHGNVNPGGFDYEAWLLERGIRATGYVRPGASRTLEAPGQGAAWSVDTLRQVLRERFYATLASPDDRPPQRANPYAGVLVALAIGDQSAIPAAQWQLFARTGITHLMSISGLHVTMLAALAHAFAGMLWRALALRGGAAARCAQRLPLPPLAALAGLLAAAAYCLLAGFGVPAQRTLYMLAGVALARLVRREVRVAHTLLLALLVVVVLDPWAVLSAGFWLSFCAVAFLLQVADAPPTYTPAASAAAPASGPASPTPEAAPTESAAEGGHWPALRRGVWAWLRAQWAIGIGMLPILLALFGQFSLVSPLANAIAIPLVSFVVTPLALLATLPMFSFLLWPAHALLGWLMQFITRLAEQPWAVWQQAAAPPALTALALLGALWLLVPAPAAGASGSAPGRWLSGLFNGYRRLPGALLFLPLLLWHPVRPEAAQAWVRVLDIGQGLAVHVQTQAHDLLFDTGPDFSGDADAGNRLIVPYLHSLGVHRLDTLLLSHGDADHIGGARSVLAALPVAQVLHGLDENAPLLNDLAPDIARRPCHAGLRWTWDGVHLAILHPEADASRAPGVGRRRNARACVLRIEAAGQVMLLPSDIEARQESSLVARHPLAGAAPQSVLRADVLVAPHHGSSTSSTAGFLDAVAADTVIFPVGYRNRFGHPRADVLARYQARGMTLLRTDLDGAVRVQLGTVAMSPERARALRPRYWGGR